LYAFKLSPACVQARSPNKIVVDIGVLYTWPIFPIFANSGWFLKVGIIYSTKFVEFLAIATLLSIFQVIEVR